MTDCVDLAREIARQKLLGTNLTGASPVKVFTAKCSEPQVGISNGMDNGKRKPKL